MKMLPKFIHAFWLCICLSLPALAFETRAKSAYVVDLNTKAVLLNKNADQPLPPASMSKLMTLYVAFEAVRDGRLRLDEKLPVSQHAMDYTGSTMFLNTRDRVTVEDLLRGIIVLSGNDASAVIAEVLSPDGTEAGFAAYMTRRARELGMNNSTFANSNGWPHPGQRMSMRDLATLAERLIVDFPQYYPMFAETEFAFDGRAPENTQNRNPLLKLGIGADGLKTGHTNEAGYGLTGSAQQGDRRVIFVLGGLSSARERATESEAIVKWAFRQFTQKKILTSGQSLGQARVWMGRAPTVDLTTVEDLSILIPVLAKKPMKTELVYQSPLQAPIKAGDQVAELILTPDGLPETRVPIIAATDVGRGGFVARLRVAYNKVMSFVQAEGAF